VGSRLLFFHVFTNEAFPWHEASFCLRVNPVSMGHPDKLADQISDGVLDAYLAQDPRSRVACETMVTTGLAVVAGEITSRARSTTSRWSAT